MATGPDDATRTRFGEVDGVPVDLVTLTGTAGVTARIATYGATVVSLDVPDADGRPGDVVLGFDTLEEYVAGTAYFGALIGRYANRIGGARFDLDGITHRVTANEGANCLHGGAQGFDRVVWQADTEATPEGPSLLLRHTSPDGHDGFPGTLTVVARYTLTHDATLRLDVTAETDAPTVLNVTQHSYVDLSGQGSATDLEVTIAADRIVATDRHQIPTGDLLAVAGTPFDFRTPTRVGQRIDAGHEQLVAGMGYDHSWVLGGRDPGVAVVARAADPRTGRVLEVLTTEPALHFYSGNQLDGSLVGKGGRRCTRRSAVCFEPGHFPDSPNQPDFPSTVLRPGESFASTIGYRFTTA